jgi:glycolate oxidase iron-sulfur subunit
VEIEHQRPGGLGRRAFRWANFGLLLGHPRLLAVAAAGLRLYQASGLQSLVRRTGLVRILPGTLPAWEALLPRLPAAAERAPLPAVTAAKGERRGRVAMLTGCVQAVVFGSHNRATVRVLALNGWDVVAPPEQGCCGALNAHGGDHARALDMARRTIDVFERAGVDAHVGVRRAYEGVWHAPRRRSQLR